MLDPGRHHDLEVLRDVRIGLYLGRDGEELVLLPRRHVPDDAKVGDTLRVFLYTDSDDRLTATTQQPLATLGDLAVLTCVDVTPHGAFLDWGLDKDLFLPFGEMHDPVQRGDRVVVGLSLGARGRVVAGARVARFLSDDLRGLQVGQQVKALVFGFNEHGALVAVDRRWHGMIHDSELHARVRVGDELTAYVKELRRDGKVEVSLVRPGPVARIDDATQRVLDALQQDGGTLMLHDKSPPREISRRLGISKKAFKKAVGGLYRQRRIHFVDGGIQQVDGSGNGSGE